MHRACVGWNVGDRLVWTDEIHLIDLKRSVTLQGGAF